MKKVAIVVGYNPNLHRDAVGQYSEMLFSYMNEIQETGVNIEFIRFCPTSIFEWFKGLSKLFNEFDLVHIQYPVEGWGTSILPGILPSLLKILKGKKTKLITTFHEWHSMHPLRKSSIVPLAVKSDGLIFVSKRELDTFTNGIIYHLNRKNTSLRVIPIGINLDIPFITEEEVYKKRNEFLELNNNNEIIIGYFGFIYDWKQPYKMVDVIRELKDLGVPSKLIIAGDFPADHVEQKKKFFDYIKKEKLEDNISFMGFIENEKELATILSSCNAVMLLFKDGVSARRSSFWYVLDLGVPIITTKPEEIEEFTGLINIENLKNDKVFFVDSNCPSIELANQILNLKEFQPPISCKMSPDWKQVAASHIDFYKKVLQKLS